MTRTLALILALLLTLTGCARKSAAPSIHATGTHLARADAKIEGAIPHTDDFGKPLLTSARTDLKAADSSNNEAARLHAQLEEAHRRLEGRWYVRLGRWIDRMIKLLILGWFILGVGGMLLTGFGGGGLGFTAGRWILSMLPLANVFTGGSRIIGSLRAGAGVAGK